MIHDSELITRNLRSKISITDWLQTHLTVHILSYFSLSVVNSMIQEIYKRKHLIWLRISKMRILDEGVKE